MDILISEKEVTDVINLSKNKDKLASKEFRALDVKNSQDYRKIMERKQINLIYNLEYDSHNDFIYQRNSGFNQVLAKIAKANNITIGFSFQDFKESKQKYKILGRLYQNYKLCKKYNLNVLVKSFAKKKEDLQSEIILKAFERILIKRKLY